MNRNLRSDVSSALNMPLSELLIRLQSTGSVQRTSAWRGRTPSAKSPAAGAGGIAITACPSISKSLSDSLRGWSPAPHEHGRHGRNQTTRMARA